MRIYSAVATFCCFFTYSAFGECPGYELELQQELNKAIQAKDLHSVQELIDERGACYNGYAYSGFSRPIAVASRAKDISIVNLLLDRGADPDGREYDPLCPLTALQVATDLGDLSIAEHLVQAGANLMVKYCGGYTLLDWSALYSHRDLFDFYIPFDFQPSVYVTYKTQDPYIVRKLLEKGINPNSLYDGKNAMFYATGRTVKVYAEFGADPNQKSNDRRQPYPIFSVSVFDKGKLEGLLDAGADPLLTNAEGRTVIYKWLSGSWDDYIRTLAKSPKFDLEWKDPEGLTILAYALADTWITRDTVKLLVNELGANVNAVDNQGRTVLKIARTIQPSRPDLHQILIDAGAHE